MPNTLLYTLLLAGLASLSQFAIATYLPAFEAIGRDLAATPAQVQQTLTAYLLPFASGSAPAAKGVITEMCPPHLRPDALGAITLVESAAVLTTQGFFGFIYASLSAIDKTNLTFFCNGVR